MIARGRNPRTIVTRGGSTGRAARGNGALVLAAWLAGPAATAQDASPPPILQWFEVRYETMKRRTPDLFLVGYGAVWVPPPGRADTGDQSTGYDIFDRFDL